MSYNFREAGSRGGVGAQAIRALDIGVEPGPPAIENAYEAALAAYRNPMLALLAKREAPLVIALLRTVFHNGNQVVAVSDAHAAVSHALETLRGQHHEVPDKPARELCRNWVEAGWLATQTLTPAAEGFGAGALSAQPSPAGGVSPVEWNGAGPAGHQLGAAGGVNSGVIGGASAGAVAGEAYRLTAPAIGALEIAGRAGGDRARVSKSRLLSLLGAVAQLAGEIDPSLDSRVARLEAEIAEREQRIAELAQTGEVPQPPVEQLLEAAETVLLQVRELPADFAQVTEAIKAIQRDTVNALRGDDRPTGEVLRDYLSRADQLVESTPEGRAFQGALALLDDPERMGELGENLALILGHPLSRALTDQQRAVFGGITQLIESGLASVLEARRRATHVVTAAVAHLDPLRDRQVDTLLREVITGLNEWLPTSRRWQVVPAVSRLPRAELGRPRGEIASLGVEVAPPPLPGEGPEGALADAGPASLAAAKAWGGPAYSDIDQLLREGAQPAGKSVAGLFERLPETSRRPVDLVGLLELMAGIGIHDDGELATVTARRPDGSHTKLVFEAATLLAPSADDSVDHEPAKDDTRL